MSTFDRTLHFQLTPSRWLRVSTVAAHAAATVIVCWIAMDWPVVWLLLCPILCSAWFGHARPTPGWLAPDGRFRWSPDDRLQWRTARGEATSADCLDAEQIGTIAVRLTLRELSTGRRRHLLILRDSVAADDHRRLRARVMVRGRGARRDAE